jgi:hypothetical protein
LLLGLPVSLLLGGASALAQEAAPAPSSNAMINLVRLLVAQGTISRDKGDALIAEATREAQQAQATAAQLAALAPPAPVPSAGQAGTGSAASPGEPRELASNLPPPPPGTIRVPYIPQVVRDQIRDDIKQDVMREAKAERWAVPGLGAPDWARNLNLYGDLRIRTQSQFYSRFNSNVIPNFQSIVSNGPLDLLSGAIPFLNATSDRYGLTSVRARLGFDFTVNSHTTVGLQLASGNNAAPISTSATLGDGFFKRNIYLNRAFVEERFTDNAKVTLGRMDNPFLSTDALFNTELKFDGFAGALRMPNRVFGLADFTLRGGAFPLDFGDQSFPDTSTSKTSVPQKWLFSAQLEGDWRLGHDRTLKLAGGYYVFKNVQGHYSAPCALGYGDTQCSTDGRTPFFVQKGNTLFQMRDIVNSAGQAVDGPQLLGLTQPFHVLDTLAVLDVPVGRDSHFTFLAEYLRNLAFRRADACLHGLAGEPVNNGGSGGSGNICDPIVANRTPYAAGGQGFQVTASLGYPTPNRWGEWRAFVGYKYLESDVVLDSFNDDTFHLGGTNAKGYTIGGTIGLVPGTNLTGRWLSANAVSGDPLAIDVLQFDLNVAF